MRYFKYLGEQPTPSHLMCALQMDTRDLTIGKVYPTERVDNRYSDGFGADMLIEDDKGNEQWVELFHFEEVKSLDDNDSHVGTGKLKVTKAQFIDRNGDKITIKRSPCRHYYMKKPGQPQVRIKKRQLSGILTGLAAAL